MCTVLKNKNCIGRNFDYEISYNEQSIVIPENTFENKYSIIGICTGLVENYPLLYDGMNSEGLVCCGLAFTGNAKYFEPKDGRLNIPAYDFVFQILSRYKSVEEVEYALFDEGEWINITNETFSDEMPNTDLHWFIADENRAIIVEQTEYEGLTWYNALTNVMTNNPPYRHQKLDYDNRRLKIGDSSLQNKVWYSRGRETDNLCGGYSSEERFCKASYLLEQLENAESPINTITETFHLLSSVEQVYGATPVENKFEYTIYSVVYDTYHHCMIYKTYDSLNYCWVDENVHLDSFRLNNKKELKRQNL